MGSPGQRYMAVTATPQAGSITGVGFAAGPTVGAPDDRVNADDSDGPWVKLQTAGQGAAALVNTGFSFNGMRRDWNPEFYSRIKTGPSVNNIRYWVGLFSGTPVLSATPAGVSLAAFRFDTGVVDPRWQFCTGAGGALSCADTGIGIAPSTAYTLAIACDASNCVGSINGSVVATNTANLPAASTYLYYHAGITPLANGTYSFLFGRVTILHR
jgi:hypothetical protein